MEGSSGEVGMLIFLRATDALKERGFPSGAWVPTSLPISKPVSVRFMNFPLMYQDYIKRGGGGLLCKSKEMQCATPTRSWNGITGFSDHRTHEV